MILCNERVALARLVPTITKHIHIYTNNLQFAALFFCILRFICIFASSNIAFHFANLLVYIASVLIINIKTMEKEKVIYNVCVYIGDVTKVLRTYVSRQAAIDFALSVHQINPTVFIISKSMQDEN